MKKNENKGSRQRQYLIGWLVLDLVHEVPLKPANGGELHEKAQHKLHKPVLYKAMNGLSKLS